MIKTLALIGALTLINCGATETNANPCADPKATYVVRTIVEEPGGHCGAFPNQAVVTQLDDDGSLFTLACESVTQSGCSSLSAGCVDVATGRTCTVMSKVTYEGSSASGTAWVSCEGSSPCQATYTIYATQ